MDNPNPKRMLVVLAHPEAVFFSLRKLLAKFTGQAVQVVLLYPGRDACCGSEDQAEEAGELAARNMGVEMYSLGYSTTDLATVDPCMLLETITSWIDLVKPQLVITSGPEAVCMDPGEVILSKIVTRAYDECCHRGLLLYMRPVEETRPERLFTIARGAKDTENYPNWFESELVENKS